MNENAWKKTVRERLIQGLPAWEARADVPRRYLKPGWFDPKLVPDAIREWNGVGSALIVGPTGSGKTVSAWRGMRRVYRRFAMQPEPRQATGRFLSVSDLFSLVFARDYESLERLSLLDVLVIDDVGVAYETEWPVAEMDRLVDRRWRNERTTIVTTNMPPTEEAAARVELTREQAFRGRYERMYSRLTDREGLGVVVVARGDLR